MIDQRLFLVSFGAQRRELERYCFGKCGNIGIGAINLHGGLFVPCRCEDCPYVSASLNLGDAEVDFGGSKEIWHVIVRRLTWWAPNLHTLFQPQDGRSK